MLKKQIGKTKIDLIAEMGEPGLIFFYRGKEQYVYTNNIPEPIVFTISRGIVSSVDNYQERRRAQRIVLLHKSHAFVQVHNRSVKTEIVDLSKEAVAVLVDKDIIAPDKNTLVRICLVLFPRRARRIHVSLTGQVLRAVDNKIVIIFSQQPYTQSLQRIEQFVDSEIALCTFGVKDDKIHRDGKAVISDRCIDCSLCFCDHPSLDADETES